MNALFAEPFQTQALAMLLANVTNPACRVPSEALITEEVATAGWKSTRDAAVPDPTLARERKFAS